MTTYQYIISIISKYKLSSAESSTAYEKAKRLYPLIARWASPYLLRISPTGSYAKGTAIRGSTDIDLFISLSPQTPHTLSEVYNSLSDWLKVQGYQVREQNVSIGLRLKNLKIDLVPAKKQPGLISDHSIYRRKADTWTKTNINKHIMFVKNSGRLNEIRAMKIWRNLHGLEFPS
jgi:tRNA nucleotidyltransferase (CCA-adding enzyme)